MEYTRRLLTEIGLEGERVRMVNVSAAMGAQFAALAAEFTEQILKLGPNRLRVQVEEIEE